MPTRSTIEAAVRSALASPDLGDGLVSVYLFGSVSEERTHAESDVDVAVLLARVRYPEAADRFAARLLLAGRLTTAMGRDADVVVLNDAPPTFARHVMTRGRRLIVSDADADHAFLRTTLSRAADLEPFLRRMRRIKLGAITR